MNSSHPEIVKNIEKGKTLYECLEENHNLLSTLGIFGALTVFAGSMELKPVGYLLSFLLLAAMILVWREIRMRLPERKEWSLTVFKWILEIGLWVLVAYWLLEYRAIWDAFLFLPLIFGFTYLIAVRIRDLRRFKIVDAVFGFGREHPNKLQRAAGVILALIVMYISFGLAVLLSVPANAILDTLNRGMSLIK